MLKEINLTPKEIADLMAISLEKATNRLNNYYKRYSIVKLMDYLSIFKKYKRSGDSELNAMYVREMALNKISFSDRAVSRYRTIKRSKLLDLKAYYLKISYVSRVMRLPKPEIMENGLKVYTKTNPKYRLFLAVFGDIGEYMNVNHRYYQESGVVKLDFSEKSSKIEIEDLKGVRVNGMLIKPEYEPIVKFLMNKSNFCNAGSINEIGYKGLSPRYRKIWEKLKDRVIRNIIINENLIDNASINRQRLIELKNEKLKEITWCYPDINVDNSVIFDKTGNAKEIATYSEQPALLRLPKRKREYDTLDQKCFILRSEIAKARKNDPKKVRSLRNEHFNSLMLNYREYFDKSRELAKFTNKEGKKKFEKYTFTYANVWLGFSIEEKLERIARYYSRQPVNPTKRGLSLWEQAYYGLKTYYCLVPYRTIKLISLKPKESKFLTLLGKTPIKNPDRNIDLFRSGYRVGDTNTEESYAIPTPLLIRSTDPKTFFEIYGQIIPEGFFPKENKLPNVWNAYNLYWVRTNYPLSELEQMGKVLLPNGRGARSLNYSRPTISDMVDSILDQPCSAFYPEDSEIDRIWDKEFQEIHDLKEELKKKVESNAHYNEREAIVKEMRAKKKAVRSFHSYIPSQHVLELSPKFARDDFVRAFNQFYSSLNTAKGLIFSDTGSNLTGKSRIRINSGLKRMQYKADHAIFAYLSKIPELCKINYDGKVFRPNSTHNYRQIVNSGLKRFFGMLDHRDILEFNEFLSDDLYYCPTRLQADYERILELCQDLEDQDNLFDLLYMLNEHGCLVKSWRFGYLVTEENIETIKEIAKPLRGDLIWSIYSEKTLKKAKNHELSLILGKDINGMSQDALEKETSKMFGVGTYMEHLDKWEAIESHWANLVKDLKPSVEIIDGVGRKRDLKLIVYAYWADLPKGRFSNKSEEFREFKAMKFVEKWDPFVYIENGIEYSIPTPIKEIKPVFKEGESGHFVDSNDRFVTAKIVKVNGSTIDFERHGRIPIDLCYQSEAQYDYVEDIAEKHYVNDLYRLLVEVKEEFKPYFDVRANRQQMTLFNEVSIQLKRRRTYGTVGEIDLANGIIEVSPVIADMHPDIVKYVIFHELAHILEENHTNRFKEIESAWAYYNIAVRAITLRTLWERLS